MTTTVVTVKYLNQPKTPAAHSGSVKGDDDVYYGIPKAMLTQLQVGGTYELDWKQNGAFKNVSAIRPVAVAAATAGPPSGTGSVGNPRQRTDPQDSANMWCCAIMCSLIKAGQVSLGDLYEAEIEVRQRHREVMMTLTQSNKPPPAPKPTVAQEMSDEIPY
jgi:hypothetical protein